MIYLCIMHVVVLLEGLDHKDKVKLEILQSMSKAREDGCSLKVRYGKVLICGAGAAGKTNFLNLAINGREFSTSTRQYRSS